VPIADGSSSVSRLRRKGVFTSQLFAGELAQLLFRSRTSRICVLAFYMDDSADRKQERIYVVAGFLGRTDVWFEAERHWEKRVKSTGLDYFRTNECLTLTGEFAKLVKVHGAQQAREHADELVADLWSIIKSADLGGFCFLGPMPAYKSVQSEPYGEYVFERDPYVQAHQHLIYQVARHVCDHAKKPEPVAFVFDEHSKAKRLMDRWEELKTNSPIARPCMGTLAPLDDRMSPAIQMGDLIANTAKRTFEDSMHDPMPAVEKLQRKCGRYLLWIAAWTGEYLRELKEASIDAATTPSLAFKVEAE